jgi:hypothetical protein
MKQVRAGDRDERWAQIKHVYDFAVYERRLVYRFGVIRDEVNEKRLTMM